MAVRQISTVCSFVLEYVRFELPEDTMVKVRTMWGIHRHKEERDNCTLKFRPWNMRTKPFEALKQRLNRYVKRGETVVTAAAAVTIAPVLEQVMNGGKEGEDNRWQPRIQPMWFAKVRQKMKENSTSLSLEHEEQPMVSPGAPNIFKDTRSRKQHMHSNGMFLSR